MRLWAACHRFPLVEVWTGLGPATPVKLLLPHVMRTVASNTYARGMAALSEREAKEGASFDAGLAKRLAELLPQCPPPRAGLKSGQFVEGNVDLACFASLLDRVCRRAGADADIFRRFVDLGSGHGHAVLAAHLLQPFRSCVGCELDPDLVLSSRAAARRYGGSGLAALARSPASGRPADLFVEGDLRDLDWSDASVVFANGVTWPRELIGRVASMALALRRGAVLLTAVRPLPWEKDPAVLDAFDVRGEACMMSFMPRAVQLWAYQRR